MADVHKMSSGQAEAPRRWYARGRWAYVFVIIGVLIIILVASTWGTYGAWMMWIAVPLLMVGLGYLFLINMLMFLKDSGVYEEEEKDEGADDREE